MTHKELSVQILEFNYWEHFKHLKDVSLILPIEHSRRKEIEKSQNEILKQIQSLKS